MRRELPGVPLPFEELMRRHEREIMRYVLRVTGNREDAADLSQETWLRAYRAYPRVDSESDLRPWLYAIATNLCRNRVRDGARRARLIVPDSDESPAAEILGKANRSNDGNDGYAALHVREMLGQLPAKQRQAVYLRYFAGLEYKEIATTMNCSEESARANVWQAMKKLKIAW